MTVFSDVQQILDQAVGFGEIGAHGRFWRALTRDEFVSFRVFGQIPLIQSDGSGGFDPDTSNLIKALRGQAPFGRDLGVPGARYRRMPAGRPQISDEEINIIRAWILDGCP